MIEEKKVSLILPSLNVEKYIGDCLESVCGQTLQAIEIICVDAGSTDGTQEIIQEFQKRDPRISLILSDKKSYGYQVNLGIQESCGKYIGIVDTDDMADAEMYGMLFQAAEECQADFVKSDYCEYFAGMDPNTPKKRRIINGGEQYSCVLNPSEHPNIFRQLYPAAWSGIYRRQFLKENGIRYNETLGASYQDTGFWLLTYFFAKRAYFIDRSFYMYRTDNTASSVYDTNKVYCICDEWQYVAEKLSVCGRLEEFREVLSFVFYRKYKRNLERISEEARGDFLCRFSGVFKRWNQSGYLSCEMFSDEEKIELQTIMADSEKYYVNLKSRRGQFLSELGKIPELIIYGAGKVGREILNGLGEKGNVVCMAVSEKCIGEEEIHGRKVRCIDDLKAYGKSAYVVVAVMTAEYQQQMERRLQELGFEHVVRIPYGLFQY